MQTMIITGATSGIGKALMKHFVSTHTVIGIGRSTEKIETLSHELQGMKGTLPFHFIKADFTQLNSVRNAVKEILDLTTHIDVLINNAAVVSNTPRKTMDGYDLQYQVNHLAGVVFIEGLKDYLTDQSLVITTSSEMHQQVKLKHSFTAHPHHAGILKNYSLTKFYNLLSVVYYTKKYPFTSIAVHPGLIKTDIGVKNNSKLFGLVWNLWTIKAKKPEDTVFGYACLVNKRCIVKDHYYYYNGLPIRPSKFVTEANAEALMHVTLSQLKEEHNG